MHHAFNVSTLSFSPSHESCRVNDFLFQALRVLKSSFLIPSIIFSDIQIKKLMPVYCYSMKSFFRGTTCDLNFLALNLIKVKETSYISIFSSFSNRESIVLTHHHEKFIVLHEQIILTVIVFGQPKSYEPRTFGRSVFVSNYLCLSWAGSCNT